MAYDTSKLVTLGQAMTIAQRTRTECQGDTSAEVATDDEVTEALNDIFGTTEIEEESGE